MVQDKAIPLSTFLSSHAYASQSLVTLKGKLSCSVDPATINLTIKKGVE